METSESYYPPEPAVNLHTWECKPCGFKDNWVELADRPLYMAGRSLNLWGWLKKLLMQ